MLYTMSKDSVLPAPARVSEMPDLSQENKATCTNGALWTRIPYVLYVENIGTRSSKEVHDTHYRQLALAATSEHLY
jgi:hypothetical protein